MNYVSPNIKMIGKSSINMNNRNEINTWGGNIAVAVGGILSLVVIVMPTITMDKN